MATLKKHLISSQYIDDARQTDEKCETYTFILIMSFGL